MFQYLLIQNINIPQTAPFQNKPVQIPVTLAQRSGQMPLPEKNRFVDCEFKNRV